MIKFASIYKSLNIEEKEVAPVLLLIVQSVFIGIFYGAYDIGAHTLFLNVFPEDMIPKAYIISGLVGIGLTTAFSKLQTKLKFSKLASYSLLFVSVIILLMRSMFGFVNTNWVVFIVFIFFGPLNIIAILAFWGTVGRIFNLRQGKRLFGIIDTGQIIGIIISSFTIPLIISFLKGTNNILLISALSIFLAMFLEIIISKRFNLSDEDTEEQTQNKNAEIVEKEIEHEQVKLKDFTKNPYILYMALFVIFSMFAAFFVQYSFLVVTKEKYPIEEDMAKYLGFFTGSMMVFTLLIKTFVYSKLMKTYGLKISLILSPVLLALFTLIAIAAGYFGGYTDAAPGFIYFFLLISLSKLFNKTLKDALEVPSFKLLYQALAKKIRFDVQAKIDGTINEIAALVSGLILYGLGVLAFVKFIHFSVVLFILLGLWTLITIRLYKEYRNNLESSLKSSKDKYDESETKLLKSLIETANIDNSIVSSLSLLRNYLPFKYIETLSNFISQKKDVFELLRPFKLHLIELYFKYRKGDTGNVLSKQFKELKLQAPSAKLSSKEISLLLKSKKETEYLYGIELVLTLPQKDRLTTLASLLRMPDAELQKIAIRLSGEAAEKETCGTLVEYLDNNELFPYAIISLKQVVSSCHKQLIQMFYKTDISLTTQLAIVKLLGSANEEDAIVFLLENLSHHRVDIFSQSIKSLTELNYQANEKEQPRFFHPITQVIQTIAWDISALASIKQEKEPALFDSLQNEFSRHQDLLMDLLSITYDPQSVMHVKEYLDSETAEGVGYALELFDIFISDEIKPLVLLLFDDIALIEKARQLQNHFPVEIMTSEQLILNIINRDPNLISLSTKRLAIDLYTKYYSAVSNDIVAQLFNPVKELSWHSAKVINNLSPEKLIELSERFSSTDFSEIENSIKNVGEQNAISSNDNEIIHVLAGMFNRYKINPIEVSDYLSVNVIEQNVFSNSSKVIDDYFVFLILDQEKLLLNKESDLAEQKFYFEYFNYNFKELDNVNGNKVLVGIKKNSMIKLQLTNSEFIQNLLTLS